MDMIRHDFLISEALRMYFSAMVPQGVGGTMWASSPTMLLGGSFDIYKICDGGVGKRYWIGEGNGNTCFPNLTAL